MSVLQQVKQADASADVQNMSAEELLEWADLRFGRGLVLSTSFGIQSAVMLHLATQVRPNMPVIWVDTGYLPAETYEYAETLTELLNLNLTVARSPISPAQMEARFGRLWESESVDDLNRYDQIRKVEPMERTLKELGATGWLSGLRSGQTSYRSALPRVKPTGDRHRIYPILNWSSKDVYYYMQRHQLPGHPLFYQGYTTVGDAHSSRPVTDDDSHERDTRFQGRKQECGLHLV
ncbi:MAG: phosphoadenylyl-sulfate reductase [Planctomycetaceae bacterium]|nr:phosphoadenylyl-sulfate reductase [Planctomycetaceae bacterium]